MTPLGLLNFFVLQWFGVRLARYQWIASPLVPGISTRRRGFRLLRWIWPLTGWWSDFRWIARPRSEGLRVTLRVVDSATAKIRKVKCKLRRIARRRG